MLGLVAGALVLAAGLWAHWGGGLAGASCASRARARAAQVELRTPRGPGRLRGRLVGDRRSGLLRPGRAAAVETGGRRTGLGRRAPGRLGGSGTAARRRGPGLARAVLDRPERGADGSHPCAQRSPGPLPLPPDDDGPLVPRSVRASRAYATDLVVRGAAYRALVRDRPGKDERLPSLTGRGRRLEKRVNLSRLRTPAATARPTVAAPGRDPRGAGPGRRRADRVQRVGRRSRPSPPGPPTRCWSGLGAPHRGGRFGSLPTCGGGDFRSCGIQETTNP